VDHGSLSQQSFRHRLNLFLALSRTPHGLLDLATPGLAALLCLGGFPPLGVTVLGLITVFAGYTAVYALNDVMDYRADKAKIGEGGLTGEGYLDGVMVRHPMAQGLLSFKEGLAWVLAWTAVALTGAYLLNPICALILILGCILEAVYCFMLTISHWRTLVSGVVKTLGGVAAVYAVNSNPSLLFLMLLFLFIFSWEIGGQNLPADWHDLEADRRWQAKTVPVRYGPEGSCKIILGALILTVILLLPLMAASPLRFPGWTLALAVSAGGGLLIIPALRLCQTRERSQATALFNRASYFPVAILVITVLALLA
jgi:4-hydroxybenzoate polyprenyltransferase